MKKYRLLYSAILTAAIFILTATGVYGAETDFICTGSDDEGGFIYEWGNYGSINTNLTPGEVTEFGYIEFDDRLSYQVMKDGKGYDYKNGDLFLEKGEYLVFVYAKDETGSKQYTTFEFYIDNNILDSSDSLNDEMMNSSKDEYWENAVTLPDSYTSEDDFSSEENPFDMDNMKIEEILSSLTGVELEEAKMHFEYSSDYGNLVFDVDGTPIIITNIPNGAMVSNPVYLATASGVTSYVYYNGEMITQPEDGMYTEPGCYEIVSTLMKDKSEGKSNSSIVQTKFYFRIVEASSADIGVIQTPEGFHIEKITYNGKEEMIPESGFYFLMGDGKYSIRFACDNDSALTVGLELNRDTTGPIVWFSQDISEKKAKTPLNYGCNESGVTYEIYRNGQEYFGEEGSIEYGGHYRMIARDQNGNERRYEFLLDTEYHFFSTGMFIILGVLIVAIFIFIVAVRSRMRVV